MAPSWFGSNPVKEEAAPQLVDPQPNTKPETQNVSPTSVAVDPTVHQPVKAKPSPARSDVAVVGEPKIKDHASPSQEKDDEKSDEKSDEKKEDIEAKQEKNMTLFSRFFRACYAPELPDESKDLKSEEQIANEKREKATEEVVSRLMKGWDITEEPCSICGIPLMTSPDKLHTECPICGPAGSQEKSDLPGMEFAQGATSNVATRTQPKSSKLTDQNLNNVAGQVSDKPSNMTLSLDLPSDFDFSNTVAVEGLLKHLQTKQTNAVVGRSMSSQYSFGSGNVIGPKPSVSSRQNFSQPCNTRQSGASVLVPSPYSTGNLQHTRIPPPQQFVNAPPQQFVNAPPQQFVNAPPQQFAQPVVQSHNNTMHGHSQDDGTTHMGEDLMNTLTLQLEAANQKLVNPEGRTLAEQIKNQQETVDLIKQLSTTMEKLNKLETLNKN
eukprot:CAMPEP_0116064568 /NCGR_PEP_ID=MMETSP0322-20121206/9193_1 /TAXON_ID=163516 /ORGANISM="Leptocylindrus danicus var. apora, Strain B651" /LENGTH=436 /DNA_ID=CAMNT_0003550613 /DNA_START=42 /DNA_END=1352 /DNA_ORIENTATION=+